MIRLSRLVVTPLLVCFFLSSFIAFAQTPENLPTEVNKAPKSITKEAKQENPLEETLTDIKGHWAGEYIEILVSRNILKGFPDNTFRPEGRVSRAEFASILIKSLHLRTRQLPNRPSFQDVLSDNWAFPYVETARAYGLVSGSPQGYFYPDKPITRLESMLMLAKAARLPLPNKKSTDIILADFIDESDLPQWARQKIAAVVQQGVFINYPDKTLIEPNLSASRAEVAVMSKMALLPQVKTRSEVAELMRQKEIAHRWVRQQATTVVSQTRLTGTLETSISSEINQLGTPVRLTIDNPLSSPLNKPLVPIGSELIGKITRIKPSGRGLHHGQIGLYFNELQLPGGQRIPVDIAIDSDDELLHGATRQGFKPVVTTVDKLLIQNDTRDNNLPLGSIFLTPDALSTPLTQPVPSLKKKWGEPVIIESGEKLKLKVKLPITVEAYSP